MQDVVRKAHTLLAAQYNAHGPEGMCRVVAVHPDDHMAFLDSLPDSGPQRMGAVGLYRLETDFGDITIRRDDSVERGRVRLMVKE